ncbi:MAG TPA: DsbA family oxidoreductase [Xanthobacteraceae bacterium]
MSATTEPLTIDVVSDVVCPWCFIGKRRLEKALALRPELPTQVRWNPYFLNPWIPREGISRDEYLRTKFGSVERYKQISERIVEAGKEEGIPFAFEKMTRQPNTLDSQRLIRWARTEADPSRVKERLMQLYFLEGGDLSDPEVLVQAGVDCGMDGELVRRLLASDADVAEVTQAAQQATEAGISGVPCFIFGGLLAVSGAQPAADLAAAIDRGVAEREKREAAA